MIEAIQQSKWSWAACELNNQKSINEIMTSVCNAHGIMTKTLASKTRKAKIVGIRVIFARRAYKNGHTLESIGESINRDHTTIVHYLNHYKK